MEISEQIEQYFASVAGPKQADLRVLDAMMRALLPDGPLRFLDGRDESGKVVSNPNVGYGSYTTRMADGSEREFYRLGLSANTTGISVYVMGLPDRKVLPERFGSVLGKAEVTGYCIKFKSLSGIDLASLEAALRFGLEASAGGGAQP